VVLSEVTRILDESDDVCAARLFPLVYAELRWLASKQGGLRPLTGMFARVEVGSCVFR
jgi:hypothetical protein